MASQAQPLNRDDWADAALDAIAAGGLAAVAVEPIAARLQATKGSFYWHFANRAALVDAAVQRWAEHSTDALIRELAPVADPAQRLRRLFESVFAEHRTARAELALLAHADDPQVAATLAQVTERRVAFVERALVELGFAAEQARHRAVLAYTAHIGLLQAQRASAGSLLPRTSRRNYLDFLYAVLVD